jgi:hypothetical protein
MYEYDLAVYFWSTLAAVGLAAPFAVALARETKNAIQHFRDNAAPPSVPSAPLPSHPGGC